jgi:hypothetical protein
MASAFLSYSAKDAAIAQRLASELTRRGVYVWFDQKEILPGDSITERINEGIRSVDYLIVLLSANSNESAWVQREIGAAFERFRDQASTAIIPVKIDDAPISPYFQTIRYVDISDQFEDGIREILTRIHRDETAKARVSQLLNVDDLAKDLASEREVPRGAEFYVTAVLGVLTIIATLIVAWPTFQTAFAQIPKVYYDVKQDVISLPPGSDEHKALQTLRDAGIAPAALRIRIVNKGQAVAKETKVGSQTSGSFLYAKTDPATGSKAVWVNVALSFSPGDKEAAVQLKELVPDKVVVINLGFEPPNTQTSTDVVADGTLAERVSNIEILPRWTLWKALDLPIRIFFAGLLISLTLGIGFAAWRNPRLRAKLLDLLDAIAPPVASVIRALIR